MRLIKDIATVTSVVTVLLILLWLVISGNDLLIRYFNFDAKHLIALLALCGPLTIKITVENVLEKKERINMDRTNKDKVEQVIKHDLDILAKGLGDIVRAYTSVHNEVKEIIFGSSERYDVLTGDSPTTYILKEEKVSKPVKRGTKCGTCSNLKKKELMKMDSCPECGRSLFALKGRGW